MKRSKYQALTVAEFQKVVDEFLYLPEEAQSVLYFKIRVKRQFSTGEAVSLKLEDV